MGKTYAASDTIVVRVGHGRTFVLTADVSGELSGGLYDWPANIQDGIYAAMETLQKKTGIKELDVMQSYCARDVPTEPWHVVVAVAEPIRSIITKPTGEMKLDQPPQKSEREK